MVLSYLSNNRVAAKQIFSNLVSLFGMRFLQRGLGIVTLYFMVRAITQHELGEYQFVLIAASVLGIFNLSGLDNAIMQSVSRGHLGTYRQATKIAFSASWLGSLVLVGLGAWHWKESQDLATALWVTACLFPFTFGLIQWKSIIVGQEKFRRLLWQESATAIATNIALITALLNQQTYLPLLVGLYLLPPAIQNIRCTLIALKLTAHESMVESDSISYGIKTSAYMVVSIIAEQIERLLVFYVLSPATLGLYAAADRLSEIIRSGTQDFAAVLAPRFAKLSHYPADVDRLIKLFCIALGAIIVLFAFTVAPWLMLMLFGPDYAAAIPYAQGLLCAVAVGNIGQFQFRFVRSQLDTANFRRILVGTSVYRIIAACILVPVFGLWGVVATIFSYRIVVSLISTWALKRHYKADGKKHA